MKKTEFIYIGTHCGLLDPLHCRQHRCQQQTHQKGAGSINEETDALHANSSKVAEKKSVQGNDRENIVIAPQEVALSSTISATSSPNTIISPTFKSSVLRIRLILGEQIALALALLVASDILDTVLKPSHAYEVLDVVKMGFVTILRTGLAYFLAREIKELEEEHKEDTHQHHMPIPHSKHHHAQGGHMNAITSEPSNNNRNKNNTSTQSLRGSPEGSSRLQRARSNSIQSLQSYTNHPGYNNSYNNAKLSPRATMQYNVNSNRQSLRSTDSIREYSEQAQYTYDSQHPEDRRRRRGPPPQLPTLDTDMDCLHGDEGVGDRMDEEKRRGEEMYYYEDEDNYGYNASGQPSPYYDNYYNYAPSHRHYPTTTRLVRSQSSQNSGASHRTYTYDMDTYEVDRNSRDRSRSSSTQRPWSRPSSTRHDLNSLPNNLHNDIHGNYARASFSMNGQEQAHRAVNDHGSNRPQSQRQRNHSFDRNNSNDPANKPSPRTRLTVVQSKRSTTDVEGEESPNEVEDADRHLSPEDSKPSSALLSSNNNSKTNSHCGSSQEENNSIREEENENDDEVKMGNEVEDGDISYPLGLTQRRQRAH